MEYSGGESDPSIIFCSKLGKIKFLCLFFFLFLFFSCFLLETGHFKETGFITIDALVLTLDKRKKDIISPSTLIFAAR